MNRLFMLGGVALAMVVTAASQTATAADLRDAVPSDVYLAMHHRANPERDYQKAYFEEVWKTVEETRIVEKLVEAVQTNLSAEESGQLEGVRTMLSDALEPIDWDELANSSESVYAQRFSLPTVQHLVMIRMGNDSAESCVEAVTNLFKLAETASDGGLAVVTETEGDVALTSLQLPPMVPFHPCVGTVGDVFVFSTTAEFAREGISLLGRPDAESKFDDPRVKLALSRLPEPEDGLTFFDGKALLQQLGQLPNFIRVQAPDAPQAERVIGLIESALKQADAFDFEVTVEYTEGNHNRSASFGRFAADAGDKVVGKMFVDQKPFEDWSRWVPENATGFSLSSGASLHPLYAWLTETIPQQIPEAQFGLDQFAAIQEQLDLYLDEDLLQSFTGESISITLPASTPSPFGGSQSVTFVRCTKPDRIRELVHRLFDKLQEIPQLQSQRLSLKPVAGMEGFEEISATMLGLFGVRPVIGFHEEWMVCGSHADAVQAVLATLSGDAESIASSDRFQQFKIDVDGPVTAISYSDLAAGTRAMAQGLQQVGTMLPLFLGMAGQNPADLKPAQKFLALLPSIGKIVGKFDFYQSQLSVTQPGDDELTYTRRSVTLIRPPQGGAGRTNR